MERKGLAVVAVGGNALIKDKNHQTVQDQYQAAVDTMVHIADMILDGWDVVVTHGNGPQVGFILRRSELSAHELHEVPLDYCGADSQGSIGYMFQQALHNEFLKRGIKKQAATIITQTVVDSKDPAFQNPSKPIGSFMSEEQAKAKMAELGWTMVEDAGRGWRRVVASPLPVEIIELEQVKALLAAGFVPVTAGGGGIPVVRENGVLRGVAAVIDKDLAAWRLAEGLDADVLLILTEVEHACLDYGRSEQRALGRVSARELRGYLAEGHFAAGSMGPKVEAALRFAEGGRGRAAVITSLEMAGPGARGEAGTVVTG